MKNDDKTKNKIKYLSPDNLHAQLKQFTAGMAVTKGSFELTVPNCTLEDIEWNHMDQMHRPAIHNTYEKGIRIASGKDFAVSLTQWKKWPFLITVTDIFVARGLFYQSLTLAGVIFVHSIISMEEDGDNVKLKDEWYIASHKLFRFLHRPLNKKLYSLNVRLQEEDEQVRQGRFALRKQGFRFQTDVPDYYNSNVLGEHTLYPKLVENAFFTIDDLGQDPITKQAGNLQFVAKKDDEGRYHIWPAACPHEGGPLNKGKQCGAKITCPWHGLQFTSVQLSLASPFASRYGFEYYLNGNQIFVSQIQTARDAHCSQSHATLMSE